MRQKSTKYFIFISLMMATSLIFLQPAAALMIGDTITGSGISLSPMSAVIDNSIEFTFENLLLFDFAEGSLTVTSNEPTLSGWFGLGNFVFGEFDDPITDMAIESNDGFAGDILNFSFTSSTITLAMNAGQMVPHSDSSLVFAITQSNPVPEPATILLLSAGLMGLAGFKRRFIK